MKATSLSALKRQAEHCRNCPLWANATQTVFGEGSQKAKIVIVGEQPGKQEDLAGRPFVGPAGKLLDRALEEAGINRREVWVTNAVKHFKWKQRGKVRLHQKPSAGEIDACRPWLMSELAFLKPLTIVLMGATAGRSLTGRPVSVMKSRGILEVPGFTARVILTVHPSFLLRIRDGDSFESEYARFVEDLKLCVSP
jgi:uracil-DNA glycosylase family protein